MTYYLRSKIERRNGHLEEAQIAGYKALEKFEEMGDTQSKVNMLNALCLLDISWYETDPTYDLTPARTHCKQALALSKTVPSRISILMTQGRLERATGNLTAACHSWQAALNLANKTQYEKVKEQIVQLLNEVNCTS